MVAAFGPEVLDAAGALDRPALGRVVFGDADARRRLEAILHPRIRARSAALNAAAPADAIVVNDVPLLVEVGHRTRVPPGDRGATRRRRPGSSGWSATGG